jgi:ABC-type transporter MlaC component
MLNSIKAEGYVVTQDYEINLQKVIKDVLATIPTKKNQKDLDSYLEKVTSDNFAFSYISMWSLGKFARSSDKEALTRYLSASKKYMISYYGNFLITYNTQYNFTIVGSEKRGNDEYLVYIEISHKNKNIDSSKSSIQTAWKLKYNKTDAKYYIIDVVVNSISLVSAQRQDFESFLSQNNGNLDELSKVLLSKIK